MFTALIDDFQLGLAQLDADVDDSELVDRIRQLERAESSIAAVRARMVTRFASSQRAAQIARGAPADRVGRGIAAQVGLARRMSPYAASRYVAKVEILVHDLPKTFAGLTAGELPEYRALLVAKEVAWLSSHHRRTVDAEIAPQLGKLGAKRLVDSVKKIAYRLDPHGYLRRLKIAETERCVTVRPADDGMVRLSLLLPMTQGIGAYAQLRAHAMARRGVGDEQRTLAQLMADTAVERLTGRERAEDIPIEVCVVMTDQTLLNHGDGRDHPATVVNGGVIPAALARRAVSGEATVFLRRLYADPAGRLVGMESQRRLFTQGQRTFLILRDQTCRTPWCDAPIRHADHVVPHGDGGATTTENGQGLCEACNHTKQTEGWTQYRRGDQIVTVTPTGHVYTSEEPTLLEPQVARPAAA